uniref:Uncharacterized protein n=1 Tax=Arundo donax TaxID=35708 RepID=A0A0A9CRV5_ARUDO
MFRNRGSTFQPLGIRYPWYSTSSTASRKVKERMDATRMVSWITRLVMRIRRVSAHVRGSSEEPLDLAISCCSSMTALRTEGWSPRNLTIQVRTLAVVSRAAKMTPMTLSAIWSSVRASRSSRKEARRSLPRCRSRRAEMI